MFRFQLSQLRWPRFWCSPRALAPRRRSFRPRLERLEDRQVLATFIAPAGVPSAWEDPNNWSNKQLPEDSDHFATIPAGEICILDKNGATVDVTRTDIGGSLQVIDGTTLSTASLTLGILGSPAVLDVGNASGSTATVEATTVTTAAGTTITAFSGSALDINGTATVAGFADIFGVMDDGTGAVVSLTGNGTVETGGNLEGGINSTTTFVGGSSWTVQPGGQLSDGRFIVNSGLTINGSLTQAKDVVLNPTGTLSGPGSFQAWGDFLWTGGAISLSGGFTIEPTAAFTVSGGSTKNLYGNLTNDSPDTTLGGSGSLVISPFTPTGSAALINYQGTIDLSAPVSINPSGGSFVNETATIDVQGSSTITGPFTSDISGAVDSVIDVGSGVTLTLAGNDSLGGDISNSGTIVIPTHDTTTVVNNLTYDGAAGSLLRVSGGTLAVASTAVLDSHGDIEVATQGTLSAQGPIDNYATLTLDPGGSTFTGSATLTNEGGLSVGGSGDLLSDSASITNDTGGTVTVSAGGRVLASGGFTNDGTLTDGGTMTVTGALENHGAIEVQSGGLLQDSGAFTNDAALTVDAGGLLGADSLDEAGSLIIQIASAGSYGVIAISGTVTFEDPNYLTVELVGGYNPSPGTQFAFLSYGSESGTVSQITSPDGNWTIIYDTHTAYLVAG